MNEGEDLPEHELEWDESQIPNAADDVAIQEASKKAKRSKDQSADFWRMVMSTPIGRSEMWALLQEAHAFDEKFMNGPVGFPDPLATWFQAGVQRYGFWLYRKLMKLNPEGVIKMHEECDHEVMKTKKIRKSRNELE